MTGDTIDNASDGHLDIRLYATKHFLLHVQLNKQASFAFDASPSVKVRILEWEKASARSTLSFKATFTSVRLSHSIFTTSLLPIRRVSAGTLVFIYLDLHMHWTVDVSVYEIR